MVSQTHDTNKKYRETLTPGDAFFDIESLKNVFTLAEYLPADERIIILAHLDTDSPIRAALADEYPRVMSEVKRRVHTFIPSFMERTGATIEFTGAKEYVAGLIKDYKGSAVTHDTPRKFGFNSMNYDLPMLNYVMENRVQIETETGTSIELPDNSAIRNFSDTIISTKNLFEAFGNNNEDKQNYYKLKKTHRFIDIQRLNEGGRFISLKRLSGYTGNAILESDRLSGENAKIDTVDDLIDLLVYNIIDSVNTALLFQEKEYSVPFKQRTQMLNRFKKEFNGKLMQDSTSAQFIEAVISPKKNNRAEEEKIEDDPYIYLFYPTNCAAHFPEIRQIEDEIAAGTLEKKAKTVNGRLNADLGLNPDKPRFRYNEKFDRVEEDVLEHASAEYDIPQAAYTMYDRVRNSADRDHAKQRLYDAGIITALSGKNGAINAHVPVRESNAYVTFSIGGIHGEYYDRAEYLKTLDEKNAADAEIEQFNRDLDTLKAHYGDDTEAQDLLESGATAYLCTKRDKITRAEFEHLEHKDFVTGSYKNGAKWKQPKKLKNYGRDGIKEHSKTVYAKNVQHADISSQYPSYISNLGIFFKVDVNKDTGAVDVYSDLLNERLRLKSSLPKDFTTWSEADIMNDIVQQLNKLLLNSASGVIDATYDTNIRVNNKAMTMRICGQLILGKLVYLLTDAGAQVVSINTDGVYYTGVEDSVANKIIEDWCEYFKMDAEPEGIELFITKDSNNRLEVEHGEIKAAAGGTIRHYKGAQLDKQPSKPTVIDNALVSYLIDEPDPLSHFDRDKVKAHFQKMIDIAKAHPEYKRDALKHFQWIMASNPSSNRFMAPLRKETAETAQDGKVFRIFLVEDSDTEIKLVTISKQNKDADDRAIAVARNKGFYNKSNENNHAKFTKIGNVALENNVIVDNHSVDDIDISMLDKLDLEQYVDITEQVWKSWSDNYVTVGG